MQGDGGQKSTFPVHVLSPGVCEGLALAASLFRCMTARSVGSRLHAACLGRFADAGGGAPCACVRLAVA